MQTAVRALAAWFVLICAEIIHGGLRRVFLVPRVGELRSSQIGVVVGSLLILYVSWLMIRWIGPEKIRACVFIGFLWLALTLAFEFGFGHYVFNRSWDSLFSDYDLGRGGLLSFGMAVVVLAPLIAARLRKVQADR